MRAKSAAKKVRSGVQKVKTVAERLAPKPTVPPEPGRVRKGGVPAVPDGFHTVTPNLCVNDAAGAIAFYERALGAKVISRMVVKGSPLVWHAHLKIGDSSIFINDPMPGGRPGSSPEQPSPISMFLYVEDCDRAMRRALEAGMTETMAMMDAFWGDRMGAATDPYGNSWSFATQKKRMTQEEVEAAGAAFAEQTAKAKSQSPAAKRRSR